MLLSPRLVAAAAAGPTELPADLSLWDKTVTLRAGVGYKDNLLLSNATRERSPFEISGIELFVFRLPIDGPQVNFFANFDDTRYWMGKALNKEQFLGSQLQIKQQFNDDWSGKLTLEYVYQNQVIDASDTVPSLSTLRVIGHTVNAGPSVRRNLADHQWLEGEWTVTRQYFAKPLDDYWAAGPKLTWGWSYGHKSELTVSYDASVRISDSAPQTDASGVAITGTTLEYWRQRAEITLRHNWDEPRHWRTVTRLGFTDNTDNSAGFFDFRKYQFSQQLRYVSKAWDLKLQAKYSRYDYPVQTIASGSAVRRSKDDFSLDLRAERSLGKSWKLFAEFEHEQAVSNRTVDEYSANTVMAGVEWEF